MAVTVARVARGVIKCPSCGEEREVTDRSRRRSAQQGGIPCVSCRGGQKTRVSKDSDLRFWLTHFGARVPRGVSAREFITAGGAPKELLDLARQCHPDLF